jgi:hypothetical protein
VADTRSAPGTGREPWPEINTEVAHVARVYDYLLGGKANFAVDRKAAEHGFAAWPGGLEAARADVRSARAALGRVIRYLAAEQGIRQFLDIGSGIPAEENVHQVAQQVAPESRIVYVDHDPIVLAHAHRLLTSTPEGATDYIDADLAEPKEILDKAAQTLDFGKPVAIILFGILHFFGPGQHPEQIVAELLARAAPGSFLAVSHLANDVFPEEMSETIGRLSERVNQGAFLRSRQEVARFFDGLELVGPGLVQMTEWGLDQPTGQSAVMGGWLGVARKP